jgi:hypothetical protein
MTEKKPRPDRSTLLRDAQREADSAERYASAALATIEPHVPPPLRLAPSAQVS